MSHSPTYVLSQGVDCCINERRRDVLETQASVVLGSRLVWPKEEWVVVWLIASVVLMLGGHVRGILALFTDITRQ